MAGAAREPGAGTAEGQRAYLLAAAPLPFPGRAFSSSAGARGAFLPNEPNPRDRSRRGSTSRATSVLRDARTVRSARAHAGRWPRPPQNFASLRLHRTCARALGASPSRAPDSGEHFRERFLEAEGKEPGLQINRIDEETAELRHRATLGCGAKFRARFPRAGDVRRKEKVGKFRAALARVGDEARETFLETPGAPRRIPNEVTDA